MNRTPHRIILSPLLTEKSTLQTEKNAKVCFKVARDANKIEIRKAVEEIFQVKVVDVNTTRIKGKWKRLGWHRGKRADWKKAIVTLAPGQKIELFEGV